MHQCFSVASPTQTSIKMMKLVVLSCLLAAVSGSALLGYAAPYAYSGYAAPLAYSAPLLAPYNYRGPLSLAPGQPANILAADGRPLDTLDVNLDRSAHFTAKALSGAHLLKKRSVALAATPLINHVAYTAPLSYTAPLAYSAPITTYTRLASPYAYSTPYAHYYWRNLIH